MADERNNNDKKTFNSLSILLLTSCLFGDETLDVDHSTLVNDLLNKDDGKNSKIFPRKK